jgi:hypothetical protein
LNTGPQACSNTQAVFRALVVAAGIALAAAAPTSAATPVPAGRYVAKVGDVTITLQLSSNGRAFVRGGAGTFDGSEFDGYAECSSVTPVYYARFGRPDGRIDRTGRFTVATTNFEEGRTGALHLSGRFVSARTARVTYRVRVQYEGESCRERGTVTARRLPRPRSGCRSVRGTTLASTRYGRVFERRGVDDFGDHVPLLYGCLYRTNRPIALEEDSDPITISNVTMAGRFVAYEFDDCPAGCDFELASVNLATGDVRRRGYGEAISLLVNTRGSIAWSAKSCDVAVQFSCPFGHALVAIGSDGHRGLQDLDEGAAVDGTSLELRGSVASWFDAGVQRSAPVD